MRSGFSSFQQGRGRRMAVSALAILVVGSAFPAAAQSNDLSARLSRIEREIDTLSRSVYKGEMPPDGVTMGLGTESVPAQMDERLSKIEQSLRDLTGQLEQQGNDVVLLRQAVERGQADTQMRLLALEQKAGTPPATASVSSSLSVSGTSSTLPDVPPPTVSSPSAPASLPHVGHEAAPAASPTVQPLGNLTSSGATGQPVVPSGDPTQAYENAMLLLKQKDYTLAEKSFRDFLVAYPDHTLVPNVKYWLGETRFAQRQYQEAARLFAEGYQQYPKGVKAPDNLLKLGLSLAALGKTADACVAILQIRKDFPTGAAAVADRASQEIKRLNCVP